MANPFDPAIDPDLFSLANPPAQSATGTMRQGTPSPQPAAAFAMDDVEKTPPPFFNSLPALANLSSSPALAQGSGWGESGPAEGSQQKRKGADKIMRREEVEAAVQEGEGGLVRLQNPVPSGNL